MSDKSLGRRRTMRSIKTAKLSLLAVMVSSCHQVPAPHGAVAPVTIEIAPAKEPQTTRLSAMGCSVQLPGVWKRITTEAATDGSWEAASEDGVETLSVLPLPWKGGEQQIELRPDLDAIVNLRRGADLEQHGPRVVLSTPEIVDDRLNPAELYTTFDPDTGEVVATMVMASSKRACVMLLAHGDISASDFLQHARSVFRTMVVEK